MCTLEALPHSYWRSHGSHMTRVQEKHLCMFYDCSVHAHWLSPLSEDANSNEIKVTNLYSTQLILRINPRSLRALSCRRTAGLARQHAPCVGVVFIHRVQVAQGSWFDIWEARGQRRADVDLHSANGWPGDRVQYNRVVVAIFIRSSGKLVPLPLHGVASASCVGVTHS